MAKSILEAISVYWMDLARIPKGILEKVRNLCFKFLWEGSQEKHVFPG